MKTKTMRELLGPDLKWINNFIKSSVESDVFLLNSINEYLFSLNGKQMRPILSLLAAKACGTSNEKTLRCAAAAEMIHTATLLHDDVADEAPQRRGADTVQYKFSPASSVLTGDYWLGKAVSVLLGLGDLRLMSFFAKAVEDLSEGEIFQMQKASSLGTTPEDYFTIISKKTSSLFIAAISGTTYLSGASDEIIECMRRYAHYFGMAFQIRDDIFDYQPQLETGKNWGTDIKERKITLPLICSLQAAPTTEGMAIMDLLKRTPNIEQPLVEQVFSFVEKFKGIALAQEILEEYSKKAIEALSSLNDSIYKSELERIALYMGERVV